MSLTEDGWSYWGAQLSFVFLLSGFRSRYLEYKTTLEVMFVVAIGFALVLLKLRCTTANVRQETS